MSQRNDLTGLIDEWDFYKGFGTWSETYWHLRFQAHIIPSLQKNHGKDSIVKVSTIRLLQPIRMLKNYLPTVNMKDGYLKKEWKIDAIYVGEDRKVPHPGPRQGR